MQIRRFHTDKVPADGDTVQLDASEAAHAVRVLRIREQDQLVLMDGRGTVAEAEVCRLSPGHRPEVLCRVFSRRQIPPPVLRPVLYVALPRDRLMDGVLRMATELGVWRIVPVLTEHGVSRPGKGSGKDRWPGDLLTAMKQSGNPYLPELVPSTIFAEAVVQAPEQGIIGAVPDEDIVARPLAATKVVSGQWSAVSGQRSESCTENKVLTDSSTDVSERIGRMSGDIAVWIGPEAGFSDAERNALTARGFFPVTVGPCILRIETAVPALLGWLYGVYA